MIIDLHTHIFNLRYLPVKGILYRWFVPWPLAPKLARVLVAAVDRGPSNLATVIDDSERLDQYLRAKPFRREPPAKNVQHGIEQGARGIKFYPPSGYRPAHTVIPKKTKFYVPFTSWWNVRRQHAHRYRGFKAAKIDELNEQLFSFAVRNNLPLFSHHTPHGFAAAAGYGELMAPPCFWQSILKKKEFERLTIVLAHAGGEAWFDTEDKWQGSFGQQAYNLCVLYQNVYCDFGMATRIFDSGARARFRDRMARLLAKPASPAARIPDDLCSTREDAAPRYAFGEKIVYGSDWFMLAALDERRELIDRFREVFSGDLAPFGPGFFGGNSARLLRLITAQAPPGH